MGKAGTGTPKRWWCGEGGEMSDDRIALFNFCKSRHSVSKRKQGLLERLREKMKVRKETSQSSSPPTTRASQTKKQKPPRNVEIGWIHSDGNVNKQVRAKQGGGTRKIN